MTPPSERMVKADSPPRDPDIERLLHGRLHDPRLVLGLHSGRRAGRRRTRAAAECAAGAARRAGRRARARARARRCSSGEGRAASVAAPYRVRCESHDGRWHERYDPYSFPLEIDDSDLARFAAAATSTRTASSARTSATIAGVRGTRFAVWAPNAERVSVVGTFNHWDGRYHPMSVRGSSGVWELFVPELGAGELYKYELFTRDSRELKLKSDPYGAAFEQRPATAAITTRAVDVRAGTTRPGSSSARAATGSRSRSRSTRCISAPGAATPPAIS